MQPSSSSPRGLQVPSSFGARRSISHDLARFSLDLAPEHRRASHKVPYPSPPMSHSPPPPINPPSPSDPRHQTSAFYGSTRQIQPSYGSYRYLYEVQQPVQFGINISVPRDPETYPARINSSSSSDRYRPPVISPTGRPPFISQISFPPPMPPRRPKSHVASACVNCKKAHLACDSMFNTLFVLLICILQIYVPEVSKKVSSSLSFAPDRIYCAIESLCLLSEFSRANQMFRRLRKVPAHYYHCYRSLLSTLLNFFIRILIVLSYFTQTIHSIRIRSRLGVVYGHLPLPLGSRDAPFIWM
jgi:hypothetical protein